MMLAHWIVGPQLVGFIFMLVGYIQWFFPPKNINNWYGYRTDASKKSQKTWDEANHYSALLFINMGYIAFIVGFLLAWAVPLKYDVIMIGDTIFTGIGGAVIVIVKTEKHLEKTFDNK